MIVAIGVPRRTALPSGGRLLLGLAASRVVPFAYAIYKAIEWRWWMSGIRFGEVRFESKLRDGALVGSVLDR